MPNPTYKIRHWGKVYEVSDAKRTGNGKPLSWVALPTKHDGRGYRRLMRRDDGVEIFGAFVLMVEVAAKLPVRGILSDDDGPLTLDDLADKTGARIESFGKAIQVLTSKEVGINWIEIVQHTPTYPELGSPTDGQDGQDITRRDVTDKTDNSANADDHGKKPKQQKTLAKVSQGSPHHASIAHFTHGYQALYGVPYDFQDARDGAHVKWMLNAVAGDGARLQQIFDDYLGSEDPFYVKDRHSLGMLKSQFRKFVVPEPAFARTGRTDELNFEYEDPTPDALETLRTVAEVN